MIPWHVSLLIGIILCLFTAISAGIGFYLRSLRQSIDQRLTDVVMHLEELRTDVTALRVTMPREYVLREDWVLATARIESKLDRLAHHQHAGLGDP